ncbi:MAG: 3-dehydroquinate synthase [Burkholderiaceae bacterium]
MKQIDVALAGRSYSILIGPALIDRIGEGLAPHAPTRILVVTNTTVAPLYGERVQAACAAVAPTALVALPDGEQYKGWDGVAQILAALVAHRADRKSLVVAVGGGVVGDMAGFAAAIYMRGLRFVQVPTTLLAQVDSSVGGKTGINLPAGKNLVGAFHQPIAVVADTDTLNTLPARELSAGLGEIIKHGLLADAAYLDQIERDLPQLRACDAAELTRVIARSCEIKAGVVARDEHETGERALLNLGHTFGHAIESLAGYGTWLHGEAVGCGLCLAADLSRRLGYLSAADVSRVERIVAAAGLPVRIEGLSMLAAIESMRGDKKSEGGAIRFIVLESLGRAIQRTVPEDRLVQTLRAGGYV